MTRPLVIPILGNTSDLEAALARSGVVAEDASKKISGSFRSAGLAAAQEAAKIGASVDEQAAAAGRAAAAFTEMSAKITTAQRNAGKAAAAAAGEIGASVDEQRAAYLKAIAVQADYEAAQQRAADVAKRTAAEQVAASREAAAAAQRAAAEQAAAAKKAADAHTAAIKSAQGKMASLGKWTLAGGIGIAGYSVDSAMKLQSSMEQLQTQAGATTQQVNQMTQAAIKMAPSLATGPQALSESLYHAFSATHNEAQALGIMSAAAKEARISGADLTDTTTALTAAVFSGIRGAKNYTQAMGLLNATVGAGDMHFQDLNQAFAGPMLAVTKGYGLSLKDVGAALATFGDLNIRGADAATQLRMAVQYMAKPAATAGPLLHKMGLNVHSFADAMANGGLLPALQLLHDRMAKLGIQGNQMAQVIGDLFTKKGASGVTILENAMGRLESKYKQVGQGAHQQNQAWINWNKTLAADVDHLKATVASLADKFGTYLIPKLQAAGHAIQDVIAWMQRHKAAAEALAVAIGGVLGTAITVFAYTKAVAFVKGTEDMVVGMSKVASFMTGGLIPALERTGPGITQIGVKSTAAAAEVTAADTEIESANATAGASFTALGADATGAAAGIEAKVATMATGVEASDAAIEAANVTAGASFTALLGPIGLVAAALGGLAYMYTQVAHASTTIQVGNRVLRNPHLALGAGSQPTMGPAGWGTGGGHGSDQPGVASHGVSGPSGYGATGPGGPWLGAGGKVTQASFAASVLSRLGIKPTTQDIRDFTAWEQQEGGNWSNNAAFNPLNTTLGTGAGAGGKSINSAGVKAYGSWAQGLAATVATLRQSNMASIIAALRANASSAAFSATVAGSPWGTGAITAPGVSLSTKQLDALLNSAKTSKGHTIRRLLYANPLAGDTYNVERTDQGKDYGNIRGNIGAIGAGVITLAHSLSGFGQTIVERLTSGPNKGRSIYYGLETGATGVGIRQGQVVRAGQTIAHGLGTGGVEFGFWNPATGRSEGYPYFNGSNATPPGTAFARWMAALSHGGAYQTINTKTGQVTGGGANVGYSLSQLEQAFTQALQNSANSLIGRYGTVEQSGTMRTISRALGINSAATVSAGGGISGQWGLTTASQPVGPLSRVLGRIFSQLGPTASIGQITHAGLGMVESSARNSAAEQQYQQTVQSLRATGHNGLADRLVAAHKAAMAAATQEMYAEQTLKDGEMLTLTATQLKDQTQLIANSAQDRLNVTKAEYQLTNDKAQAEITAVRDMTQTVTDEFSGMVQSVQDHTQMLSDAANMAVTGINDQTQTQVDILGEKGLYGLNLVAQKLQVGLDIQKAADDRKIALAQQNLDQVTAQQHQLVSNAQISLDQVTAQQDQLAAMAQQRADAVAINQAIRLQSAQQQVDANMLHNDVAVVGPAQIAVDMNAMAPKAQQDVFNAQLRKATGTAGKSEGLVGMWFQGVQDSVNAINAAATQSAAVAQTTAGYQIGLAQQTLSNVTGNANYQIALAQGTLSGAQSAAALAEAPMSGSVAVTRAQAQTQFAGSGLQVNVYGIPADNAAAIGQAVDWVARTQLQVPA